MLLLRGTILSLAGQGILLILDRPRYVQVYSLDNNDKAGNDTWSQIGQDIIVEANNDEFGYSVSISKDGNTIAVVGAIFDANYNWGYVRIYRLGDNGTSWGQIGKDIVCEAAYDGVGISVSLSAD